MVEKRNLGSTKRIITLTDILLQQIVLHVSYIIEASCPCMAEIEHPEQYNWWLNELESLGGELYWILQIPILE